MNPPRDRFVSRREQNLVGRKTVSVRAKIKGFKVAGCKLAFHSSKFVQNLRSELQEQREIRFHYCRVGAGKIADNLPNYGICSLFFFDAGESG